MTIPQTREEAIAALIEHDVQRWGESEREASTRLHGRRSLGLALNELANRALLAGDDDHELRAAAKRQMTDADRAHLKTGG